ncbi:MAG: ATP-dependent helicase [Akkermansiaceae bacterium]|nr:ATP-dependent helicase [Akkermansiaceae bacterium]
MSSSHHHSTSNLRDNHSKRGAVGDFLKHTIQPDSKLSFVSAYFTVHAYQALSQQLDSCDSLRFLFGEPSFITQINSKDQQSANFTLTDTGLALTKSLNQSAAAKACATWIKDKAEIRSIRHRNFLHGKAYHVENGGASSAILGSSNFTVPGLGLGSQNNNVELNLVVDSDRDRRDLKAWFDETWNDDSLTKDVKDEVLTYLNRLAQPNSPEFIYYLTLYHLFYEQLLRDEGEDDSLQRSSLYESTIWKKLFSFQKDGVKGAINKIRELNGCILADSVGLGKTFSALAVIKFFELRHERVLVLCPKKLRQNWAIYRPQSKLCPFPEDKFGFDLLSHTDLSRDSGEVDGHQLRDFRWDDYDLIVIDESHNFRNNAVGKAEDDDTPRRTRYERLIEDIIQAGRNTKVLLLSATPVNNQISDLRNQISFIAGGDVARSADPRYDAAFSNKLKILSIKETCRKAQQKFTTWTKKSPDERSTKDLINQLGSDFFQLLDGLTIARSRSQIKRHYAKELAILGGFPTRMPPQSEYPDIDTKGQFFDFKQLDEEISKLTLSLYHPSHHLQDNLPAKTRAHYDQKIGNFNQEGREKILISMMKVNFLKRLESSVDSFRSTLERTIDKIDTLTKKIDAFQQREIDNPDIDFANLSEEDIDDLEVDIEDIQIGAKHKINLAHLKLPEWQRAVENDRTQLKFLLDKSAPITPARDAKLIRLRQLIAQKHAHPSTNRDGQAIRKVIVFTAFADTARYLWENVAKPFHQDTGVHAALVAGGGKCETTLGGYDFEHILTNFAPRSKNRNAQQDLPQDEEIDLLIATDCISEGQNLQDADLLINYDIHWNPVRIIQRFGRIDRIGSLHSHISLINFWPTRDLDAYIGVKHRVEARMALVDLTATGEDNLLNTEQIEDLIDSDLHYRNKQLKKLQKEILDLEDLDTETISLADFSLADFRMDLLNYLDANRAALESAENGLFAVVPTNPDIPMAQPGILFCLRQRSDVQSTEVNPLSPHYLVYVHDDGNVRLTFAQPKQCLNLFKELAAKEPNAFTKLHDLFDQRTRNGQDMKHESKLIEAAANSVKRTFQRRAAAGLFSGRDGTLPTKSATPTTTEDLELITWLIIADPAS